VKQIDVITLHHRYIVCTAKCNNWQELNTET